MKYLKLFEDHNDYYTQISEDEFNSEEVIQCDIDSRYVSIIKSQIKKEFDLEWSRAGIIEINNVMVVTRKYDNWIIYQAKDEWFYVKKYAQDIMAGPYNDFYNYYKCDQIDGLIKYLKDNEIIK
jgi:hypothetical protein